MSTIPISYDPNGTGLFPDSYVEELEREPCQPPPARRMTEAEYQANVSKWLRVKREREERAR